MFTTLAYTWKTHSSIHLLVFEFPTETTQLLWISLQGNHPVAKVLELLPKVCHSDTLSGDNNILLFRYLCYCELSFSTCS